MEAGFDLSTATVPCDVVEWRARKACALLADLIDMTGQRAEVCAEATIQDVSVSQWRAIGRFKGRMSNRPSPDTATEVLNAVAKRLPRNVVPVPRERIALQMALLRLAHRGLHDELRPFLKFDPEDWLGRLGSKVNRNVALLPKRFRNPGDFAHGHDFRKVRGEQALEFERFEDAEFVRVAEENNLDPVAEADKVLTIIEELDFDKPGEE